MIKSRLQSANDICCAVRRAVVNYQYMKVLPKIIDSLQYSFNVFLLVVRRYNYQLFQLYNLVY
jgi:hypothetical protein